MHRQVSASEIAEFEYCSVEWYFSKNGYPRGGQGTGRMAKGTAMHRSVAAKHAAAGKWITTGIAGMIIISLLLVLFLL